LFGNQSTDNPIDVVAKVYFMPEMAACMRQTHHFCFENCRQYQCLCKNGYYKLVN